MDKISKIKALEEILKKKIPRVRKDGFTVQEAQLMMIIDEMKDLAKSALQ